MCCIALFIWEMQSLIVFFYFVLLNLNFSIIQSLASSLNPHFLEFLQALGWPQGKFFELFIYIYVIG